MNPRVALYQLAGQHRLGPQVTQSLVEGAQLHQEPDAMKRSLWPAIEVIAAALGGLGIILWLAANWDDLGRMPRFLLLQALVCIACAGAALRPTLRIPLALAALLAIGGLFAYFGQTYQTGADPWQLFALWAVLALPLCLGARSDALWAPWALVAMTAVALWVHAHIGHRWAVEANNLQVYAAAWGASAILVFLVSGALARRTGAGPWALRTASTLAVMGIALAGLAALFGRSVAPQYGLALGTFVVAGVVLSQRRWFEVFLVSAIALGLNVLLVGGIVRWMFENGGRGDSIGKLLVIGLAAAALLAASVSAITRLAAHHQKAHA